MGTPISFGANNDQNIIVQLTLDKAGRVLARRDPRGNRTTFSYDQLNRRTSLTNPLGQTWQTSYSVANGVLTTTLTDPLGHTTQQVADRAGRLRFLRYQAESPKQTPDLTFTYDKNGNRLVMAESTGGVSPSRITRYGYSGTRRLKQVGFDLHGDGSLIQLVNYSYDPAGRRKTLMLPGGQTVSYGYDPKGRLSTLTDWSSQTTTYAYDGADRLATVARPNGLSSAYAYDPAGRLLTLSHVAAGSTLASFAYTVDARGNRTSLTEQPASAVLVPSDNSVNYYLGSWANDGHGLYASTDLPAAFKLSVYGSQITLTMGTGSDHGLYDVYLDGDLWNTLDGYTAALGTQNVSITAATLGWHTLDVRNRPDHNLAANGYKIRFGGLLSSGTRTSQYSYDALSRLIGAQVFPSVTSSARSLNYQYQYDVAGNRTQQIVTDASAVTTNYNYDAANRLTSDGTHSYSYDANGNLTSDGVNTYTWDRANRLVGYSGGGHSYAFGYDGDGRRTQQTVDSAVTQYLLDIQPSLAVVLQAITGANTTSYVHSSTGLQQQENPNGSWDWTLPDGLGSVRAVTDASANVLETRFYSPYGTNTQTSGSSQTVYGFTGEETDSDGLVNLRARYYNPAIGQFFNLDPLEGDAGQPLSLNRYMYVQGNVVNATDPSGMFTLWNDITVTDALGELTVPGFIDTGDCLYCIGRGLGYSGDSLARFAQMVATIPDNLVTGTVGKDGWLYPNKILYIPKYAVDGRSFDKSACPCHVPVPPTSTNPYQPKWPGPSPSIPAPTGTSTTTIDGYIEGTSGNLAGGFFIGANFTAGVEIVYDFKTFESGFFTYSGASFTVSAGAALTGSPYVGYVNGFSPSQSLQSQYSGAFYFNGAGFGPSTPIVRFMAIGATVGGIAFNNYDNTITGATFYVSTGVGGNLVDIVPFAYDLYLNGASYYYYHSGKSYLSGKCQVDVQSMRRDIEFGVGSPIVIPSSAMFGLRALIADQAELAANAYTKSCSCA